jgi:hypothetical protein
MNEEHPKHTWSPRLLLPLSPFAPLHDDVTPQLAAPAKISFFSWLGQLKSPTADYRADIDGLRAIAVSAVILLHAGVGALCGGFLGVDVFFVISGYLVHQQITARLRGREFSPTAFYGRRLRRTVPAL